MSNESKVSAKVNGSEPFAEARGSDAGCQWMMEHKDWRECGLPTAWVSRSSSLRYCEHHAKHAMKFAVLSPNRRRPNAPRELPEREQP